jgi:hypothetical protein
LVETGELKDSLTEEHGGGHFEEILGHELHFGTSNPKAGWMQRGAGGRIPMRDPVAMSEVTRRLISKTVQRGLVAEGRPTFGAGEFGASDISMFGL